MRLKKVATITPKEALENRELLMEAEELNYTILTYNVRRRRFLNNLLGKYFDKSGDPKIYIVKGRGIYTGS